MTNSYYRLGLPPTVSACAILRAAIRAFHSDKLGVRGFREARKRNYRELLKAHAAAQAVVGGPGS